MILTHAIGLFDVTVLPLTVPIHEHNFTLKCVATPFQELEEALTLPEIAVDHTCWSCEEQCCYRTTDLLYSQHNTRYTVQFTSGTSQWSIQLSCKAEYTKLSW